MSARGQLDESEEFARRGLELSGDRDSEGRRRCCIELGELDSYQGRWAEGTARYLTLASLAVPGWEAFTLDSAAMCATYAGNLDDARRFNERARSTITSPSMRAFHHYVTAEIDNMAGDWTSALHHYHECIALSRTADTPFIDGIASGRARRRAGRQRTGTGSARRLPGSHRPLATSRRTGRSSGPRCATPLTSSINSAITSSHRSYATPPTAPPKPVTAERRRADYKSLIPIRHREWRAALTRTGARKSSTSLGTPSIGG